jgi:hypothetical protein
MKIEQKTLYNLLSAIQKVGEKEVSSVLNTIQNRDPLIIDEVVDLVCDRMNFNKSYLYIRKMKKTFGKWTRMDVLSVIIYILREDRLCENRISWKSIQDYFLYPEMRVSDIYNRFNELCPKIPLHKELISIKDEIAEESTNIFTKYFIILNHGKEE